MKRRFVDLTVFALTILTAVTGPVVAAESSPNESAALEFFEKKVRPLLVNNCYNCHSADNKAAGGLRVDDHRGILQGGGRGKSIVPGQPDDSLLIRAVKQTDSKLKMPPDYRLADEEIAVLEQWIRDGAVWPAIEVPGDLTVEDASYEHLRQTHWAWQPVQHSVVPTVKNHAWPSHDIDRFVLSTLEEKHLEPVADADRQTWLRRVTFDLTGLPPTPAELTHYLSDESAEAEECVVDRLLASPAFGERWGRHWLDVARYGESTGSARNLPYPQAWKYRDYVIDALNKDKPYDRFLQEQLAGDLLSAANEAERKEQLIATGFLALGVKDVNQRFKVRFIMDNIDEQIDTVTRSILGLTVSCARCHDHKFDPISTAEYYSLAGIFQSTDLCAGLRNKMGGGGLAYYDTSLLLMLSKPEDVSPEHRAKIDAAKAAADAAQEEFERLRDSAEGDEAAPNGRPKRQVARQKWNRLQSEYVALSDPAAYSEVALGVRESTTIGDTEIRLRGEAEQLGPVVPRGFLKVLHWQDQPTVPADQSGRLQLAQWLTSPQNPLTSRVVVNRIWQHLFGAGLVRSVDNFGVTGESPSHPELLDHLAEQFVAEGWSFKRLIRTLVLTRTYRLGSSATESHVAVDPENRWLWRHSPRRLSAEELRDATLAASGLLDAARVLGSPAQDLPVVELRNNGPESQRIVAAGRASQHRSVYLPLLRTIVPTSLEVFDFADQGLVTGRRETTTVPTQALYLLNDGFVRRNALALAEKTLSHLDLDDVQRIDALYQTALGRRPTSTEVDRARFYLASYAEQAEQLLGEEFAAAQAAAVKEAEAKVLAAQQPADAVQTANSGVVARMNPAVAQAAQAQVANADDVDQTDAPVIKEEIQAHDATTAAWASLVQALFASGEFRYLR